MAAWDQMLALRTPPEIKESPEEWHAHITKTIIPYLDSLPSQKLVTNASPHPLSILSPEQDTLPYLYVLYEHIVAAMGKGRQISQALLPGGELWDNIASFITESNPVETRYGGDRWRAVVELLPDLAHLSRASQVPVLQYMAAAMLKLDPSGGTLTSSHIHFIRICMEMQAYQEALLVLDHDVHSLPAKINSGRPTNTRELYLSNAYITVQSKLTANLTRNDIHEYFLLGAMAYIGVRQWTRAAYFLEHVLSTPTNNTVTGPMLESYKKWVLVRLMAKGRMGPLPKSANSSAMRTIKQAAKYYDTLADAFPRDDHRKLAAEAHEAWSLFVEDGNSGLVNDVIHQHRRLSVSQLARIYAAVPLPKVSSKLEMAPAETESYLRSLIAEGFLKASIENGGEGNETVLKFWQNGSAEQSERTEEQLRDELVAQTEKIKALRTHVSEADRRVSMTKEYLEHTRSARKQKDAQGEAGLDDADVPFGGRRVSEDEEDENVMADVRS